MRIMWSSLATTTILLLSTALGSVPPIPAGRRAEYFLLQDDGAYQFGYDTGAGQSASANADAANQVRGHYSYVDDAGQRVSLSYTAGDAGFVPQLEGGGDSHYVSSASSPRGNAAGYSATGSSSFGTSAAGEVDPDYDGNADASYAFSIDTDTYKRTESSDAKGHVRSSYSYSSKDGGNQVSYAAGAAIGSAYTGPPANTRSKLNEDGSYAFNYNTNDQARDESADSQNNVRGSFTYKSKDDGQIRRIDYTAGAATGFVVSGDHLPVSPSSTANSHSGGAIVNSDGSYAFSYNDGDSSRQESADALNNVKGSYTFKSKDDGSIRKVDYVAGSATGYVASGDHLPSVSLSSGSSPGTSQSSAAGDGSYSFSYNAGDSSRQESADAQNNVRGSYSFKTKDDGETRRVNYEAGSGSGFVVKGSHLPVAPIVASSGFPSQPSAYPDAPSESPEIEKPSGDASYAFSYDAGDHAREESSDAQGNVKGRFSFVDKDGVQRKVDYTAGIGKGFVAQGAHIPVASTGSTSFGHSSAVSAAFNQASHGSSYSSNSFSSANAGSSSSSKAGLHSSSSSASASSSSSSSSASRDASYSYSYNAGDHSRQTAAGSQNNGQTRNLGYQSGAASGFTAKNAYLPVPQSTAVLNAYASVPSASSVTTYTTSPKVAPSGAAKVGGSYSFAYNTADQSRRESGDSQNNVRGSYSFKAKDDGATRHVDYEAGAATGFIVKGAHLPVAPSVSDPSFSQPLSSRTFSGSRSSPGTTGSYSFSYNAGDHSREETRDSLGNVRGRYSYTTKDSGKTRQLGYESGAGKGFAAKSTYIPVPPGSVPAASTSVGYRTLSAFQGLVADGSNDDYNGGDGSYSYSYETDSSKKQESADALGNVKGSFSYLGGDGISRSVEYTARGNEGFVASGGHLPNTESFSGSGGIHTSSLSNVAPARSSGGYSAGGRSLHAKSLDVGANNVRLQKYLPADSSHKYGYIFDTKV